MVIGCRPSSAERWFGAGCSAASTWSTPTRNRSGGLRFAADRIHISPPAKTDEHDREHHLPGRGGVRGDVVAGEHGQPAGEQGGGADDDQRGAAQALAAFLDPAAHVDLLACRGGQRGRGWPPGRGRGARC